MSGPETPLVPWAHPEVLLKALGSLRAKVAFLRLHLINTDQDHPWGQDQNHIK